MTVLSQIIEVKKDEVKKLRRDFSLSRLTDSEFFEKKPLSFLDTLLDRKDIAIIAELKKASPSRGLIRADFNHLKIADLYFNNQVDAVSVLTDQHFFQGNITYLRDVARIKSAPLLRKDFIIDEYQIFEARSNGADLILLIAEVLSAGQIRELSHAAAETGLEVLLEFHSDQQKSKIDFAINRLIGINNRNLENFETDLTSTEEIAETLPDDIFVVSESGIKNKEDITRLARTKTNAILVGEHLMSSLDINRALKELREWCQNAR